MVHTSPQPPVAAVLEALHGVLPLRLVPQPHVPIAVAMAASAAFPRFLSPLTLSPDADLFQENDGADSGEEGHLG
jgi:hypothetical protein